MRKKLVGLSGAGMSAESGLKTFRDADELWEGHDVYEVASPHLMLDKEISHFIPGVKPGSVRNCTKNQPLIMSSVFQPRSFCYLFSCIPKY